MKTLILLVFLSLFVSQTAHATAWTYLRSVTFEEHGGATAGNFPAVDTTDAMFAVAVSDYAFASPYVFDIKEGSNAFSVYTVVTANATHVRAYFRNLTTHSGSTVFTWDTSGSGNGMSGTILLFGVAGSTSAGTYVSANSLSVPSQTTAANDTLAIAVLGSNSFFSQPSAIDSGFTAIFGAYSAGNGTNSNIAYKIIPTSGTAIAPVWTGGGHPGVFGMLLVATPPSGGIHHKVSQ